MDGFDRIYDLHRILKGRKTVLPLKDILEQMECSRATFNRIKRHMTDFLGAPIEYSREHGGYFYNESPEHGYELPGLWLRESELHALLLMQALIKSLGAGILSDEIYPIEQRVHKLLAKNAIDPGRLQQRFRMLGVGIRDVEPEIFLRVSSAVLKQQALTIEHENLNTGEISRRRVSPQRLIHYRHNWYIDCWCHRKKQLRTFALDGIKSCESNGEVFCDFASEEIDRQVQGTYGLFPAENRELARIHFYPPWSRRVAREHWHPEQEGKFLQDGSYELRIPFNAAHPDELLMDVLRAGDRAKIISPDSLAVRAKDLLNATLALYD